MRRGFNKATMHARAYPWRHHVLTPMRSIVGLAASISTRSTPNAVRISPKETSDVCKYAWEALRCTGVSLLFEITTLNQL